MRKRTFVIFALLIFALTSCHSDTVYKKFNRNFTDSRWMKEDVRKFQFNINRSGRYDLIIDYSHVFDTPLSSVPVGVEMTSGSKTLVSEKVSIVLRDENGKQVGDCLGDYCDVQQTVSKNLSFDEGQYTVKLINLFDFKYMPNVLGIGIRVVTSADQ